MPAARKSARRLPSPRRSRRLAAPVSVTLISDATGSLGEHVLRAIFTQFPPQAFRLAILPFVNSDDALRDCLARLRRAQGVVVHATIYERFKRRIDTACRRLGLPVYDLTGPIMTFLAAASGQRPEINYQKLHELTPDYFKRVEAIEYTIGHDDGIGLRTLDQADVVLTGVSRTTKTPTSMVLAMHGYRVGNVPLAHQVEPSRELLQIPASRVVCLVLDPVHLASVRLARARGRLGFEGAYTDERAIREELAWAQELSERQGWATLDATGRSVEETAAYVIDIVFGRASAHGR